VFFEVLERGICIGGEAHRRVEVVFGGRIEAGVFAASQLVGGHCECDTVISIYEEDALQSGVIPK
jgi:hypothetical protein